VDVIPGIGDKLVVDENIRIILDSLYDGILIVDAASVVVYVNPAYTRITSMRPDDIVGRLLSEARPGSHLPDVVASGEKQLAVRRTLGHSEYMVNMVPIIRSGEIVGGISLLNEINDVYRLLDELDKSNKLITRLRDRVRQMGRARYAFDDIVFADDKTREAIALGKRIARKDMNVLVSGESGTGKELYAQSIHNAGERRHQPFLALNCAALDPNLLESELFGYEEGAFTGAKKGGKIGLFEKADGGTLFLDELGELDVRLQAKLLRALQENLVRPVGGAAEISVDVRVIAATNKDLEEMIERGLFRKDLYYRVAAFTVHLPPLRERRADIEPLVGKFLRDINARARSATTIDAEAMRALGAYDWPGNVRELKNTVEYAAMMTDCDVVTSADLPPRIRGAVRGQEAVGAPAPLADVVRRAGRGAIAAAIARFGSDVEGKKRAAEALGISLATLYNKLA